MSILFSKAVLGLIDLHIFSKTLWEDYEKNCRSINGLFWGPGSFFWRTESGLAVRIRCVSSHLPPAEISYHDLLLGGVEDGMESKLNLLFDKSVDENLTNGSLFTFCVGLALMLEKLSQRHRWKNKGMAGRLGSVRCHETGFIEDRWSQASKRIPWTNRRSHSRPEIVLWWTCFLTTVVKPSNG